jgi:hypothetical protein
VNKIKLLVKLPAKSTVQLRDFLGFSFEKKKMEAPGIFKKSFNGGTWFFLSPLFNGNAWYF